MLHRDPFRAGTMRVAVVGSAVAGLAAARTLAQSGAEVVLYEKENVVGGSETLGFRHDGRDLNVGSILFNPATYLDLITLLEELGLEAEGCDISFGASLREKRFEWNNTGFAGFFAQKRNLLDPHFWNMIKEIWKFSTDVPRYLQRVESNDMSLNLDETLAEFLEIHGYSKKFRKDYLIPICASIWSCPSELVLTLSAATVLTFCSDHKLLQLSERSQWLTIKEGLQTYVEKVVEELKDAGVKIRISTLVTKIQILDTGVVQLEDDNGVVEIFDKYIVATHAPDALQMWGDDATLSEKNALGAFKYHYGKWDFLHQQKSVPHISKLATHAQDALQMREDDATLSEKNALGAFKYHYGKWDFLHQQKSVPHISKLATHAQDALKMRGDHTTLNEQNALGAFKYHYGKWDFLYQKKSLPYISKL